MMSQCRRCGAFLSENRPCTECGAIYKPDNLLGVSLHGFKLVSCVHDAPHGALYRAEKKGYFAAVKLIKQLFDHEMIARLKREAQAIQQLEHPSAVKLFSQGETIEGYPFIIMEWIDGETLKDTIERTALSEQQLIAMLRSLCGVLIEAHQKGIIHRDLSTRNIMIQSDQTPKLLDFGFAALRGAETLTEKGTVSGTPAYMSPEQWQGFHQIDHRSDLYSLGVIAYQCLSQKLPVSAQTPLEWMKKHMLEAPVDLNVALKPKTISEPLYRTIMKAIQKSPEERQASVQEFLAQILACSH